MYKGLVMLNIKKLRDRNGEFYGSYLGEDGRYYPEHELFDEEGEKLFDFTLVEMTEEEIAEVAAKAAQFEIDEALAQLRTKRNQLIAETDWWASSDLTMTQEQIAYRQALRDITNSYSSLDNVVWPVKPEQE